MNSLTSTAGAQINYDHYSYTYNNVHNAIFIGRASDLDLFIKIGDTLITKAKTKWSVSVTSTTLTCSAAVWSMFYMWYN